MLSSPLFDNALIPESIVKRDVLYLSLCQALWMSANSLLTVVSALIGLSLAPFQQLATLPFGLQFLTAMATALPASLLMRRIGRRAGFVTGLVVGLAGAIVCYSAVVSRSFAGFCVGSALIGACNGFAQYYRLAAADVATDEYRGRAISLVLAGGVVAAVVGPNLANLTKSWIPTALFAGGFLGIAALYLVSIAVLFVTRLPRPTHATPRFTGRPMFDILRQPTFLVAACAALVGYGAMNVMMAATPLAMQAHGHAVSETAFVIQWHLIGMFAPSFFTGHLIRRFGVTEVIATGGALQLSSVAINLMGSTVPFFWAALLLLGVGWNFLFVGATLLLTETHTPEEKAKTQGVNDFIVFGGVAITAMSAGWLHHEFGWTTINWIIILPVLATCCASLWLRSRRAAASLADLGASSSHQETAGRCGSRACGEQGKGT